MILDEGDRPQPRASLSEYSTTLYLHFQAENVASALVSAPITTGGNIHKAEESSPDLIKSDFSG